MDQSLDQIISSKPRAGRRGSGIRRSNSARAQVLGTTGPSPATRARIANNAPASKAAAAVPNTQATDKIIVSNLPTDVNETQVKELFHSTVGPLREVTLHYDSAGRSKGVAAVHFQRKGDGAKAFQQYNNRLIDGKRPMKIEIVVAPQPASLASRVAPPPAAATEPAPRTGGARGKGRRGGARGGAPREKKTPKTAADLDAEMEDYTANNNAAAAPAA